MSEKDEKDVCNIDEKLDAVFSFRISSCRKKQVLDKIKQRGIQNPSDILRWCFFIGFDREFGP